MDLKNKTIHLLKHRPRTLTYADIAEKTDIGEHWIAAFACGKIENPGINNVQKLYDFLSKISVL